MAGKMIDLRAGSGALPVRPGRALGIFWFISATGLLILTRNPG
jgi:hypothetical protein